MSSFSKVLVANRGEIALRVIRGAQAMGYATVAVYSEADRQAPHVFAPDQAVCIGPASAAESYLSIERILEAARAAGADAVHPGYGFLAENADFARAVEGAGLVFIGPTPEAIDLMGSKRAAKQRMITAGVPCVPGYEGEDQKDERLIAEAQAIGCPVMVKASAGGGGRGMRLVENENDLAAAIASARSEAQNAFGSGELILEKAVVEARHVEVQVFADTHGHVVHLGERDCSVQRRHQKVVEDAPPPAVDGPPGEKMGAAAVEAAAAIGYRGAGTVEFLLDKSGAFYFMEMNTRLQVEHPVTEMITGLDLVEWQLRVAAGEPLPLAQDQIAFNGHAIEVRLCAEDPEADFMPQTGRIRAWRAPQGAGIRVDHGIQTGGEVSPFYDSMVGKLIAWGPNRNIARARLIAALEQTVFLGVTHNKDFLGRILRHEAFAGGDFDTHFIDKHLPRDGETPQPSLRHIALAATIVHAHDAAHLARQHHLDRGLIDWRSGNAVPMISTLAQGERSWQLRLAIQPGGRYEVQADDATLTIEHKRFADGACHYVADGVQAQAHYALDNGQLWLAAEGSTWAYTDTLLQAPESAVEGGDGRVKARMDGKILALSVAEGDTVAAGQKLLVLEAMKMEFQMDAGVDGVVESVHCAVGDQVGARQLLLTIAPEPE